MFTAKDIEVRVIDSASSRKVVERFHYSGKCAQNSQIHFGVFLGGRLEGALQFGPSIDKRRMAQNLGVGFNETLELNRMALSDACPKNSESRALGICLRILKKKYPHLRVIISFADACQCGDGTIYRASGFRLHSYKKNADILVGPSGQIIAGKTLAHTKMSDGRDLRSLYKGSLGYKPLPGFQMKYLFFFDKDLERRFKFVDFDKIPAEVRMYKGSKRSEHENNASGSQSEEGGATPTAALHSLKSNTKTSKEAAHGKN
jgi:hypothetical protein